MSLSFGGDGVDPKVTVDRLKAQGNEAGNLGSKSSERADVSVRKGKTPTNDAPGARQRVNTARFRAMVICGALGMGYAFVRSEWRPLPDVLARKGLITRVEDIRWIDPPSFLGLSRRALVIAHKSDEPSDLYVVTARTGPGNRIINLIDVSNLSNSTATSEGDLVVEGAHAAFSTSLGDKVIAVSVIDSRGEHMAQGEQLALSRGARFRAAVTNLQQTGQTEGYGIDRYDLVTPVDHVKLSLKHGVLDIRGLADETGPADKYVELKVDGPEVVLGSALIRERPRVPGENKSWLLWAVNTVRAVPWIGAKPIEILEGYKNKVEHMVAKVSVSVSGDNTQAEVADDLGDVLNVVHTDAALGGRVEAWPPDALPTVYSSRAEHEGEWSPVAQQDDPFMRVNPGAPLPMYITFLRTDSERPDARVYISVWDPRQIELHVAPGSVEPMGATGETGSGVIPRDVHTMTHLVGGFNGAFQALHGEYGVFAEGTVLLPAKPYAATVALLADGTTAFGTWPPDRPPIPDSVVEFRQNMTPLIDGGAFNPWRRNYWGGILGNVNDQHTARSAICMTRDGYVAYFWGASLTPRSLADGMKAARCDYGVHLDMNGSNTGFEVYRVGPAATHPPLSRAIASYETQGFVGGMQDMMFRGRKLVRRMSENIPRYIRRDERDFFYLLLRSTLPGAPIPPVIQPAQPGEGVWNVGGMADVSFPWPMAHTGLRPDVLNPSSMVNLVRIDARRVALAPADAPEQTVIANVMGGALAVDQQLRIAMTEGVQGPTWSIGQKGDGLAGEALGPASVTLRGAGIDHDGFLVLAVTDKPVPGLIWKALDLAGCAPTRIALAPLMIQFKDGKTAAGDTVPAGTPRTLALTIRAFVGAKRIFPEVVPVSPSVWQPVQQHQVRYVSMPHGSGTYQVRIAGQSPVVLRIRGYTPPADGGVPPASGTPGTP